MDARFRPCNPADVEKAVPLIYQSGPAAFRYVFSQSSENQALDFLHYVFCRTGSEFSYENHTAVLVNDELVAIGACWGPGKELKFTLSAARQILAFYGLLDGFKVMLRGIKIQQVFNTPGKGQNFLAHLSVDHNYRNQGLGTQLLDYYITDSKKLGFDSVTLDVESYNGEAKRLYERVGFKQLKVTSSTLVSKYGRVTDAHYMEYRL